MRIRDMHCLLRSSTPYASTQISALCSSLKAQSCSEDLKPPPPSLRNRAALCKHATHHVFSCLPSSRTAPCWFHRGLPVPGDSTPCNCLLWWNLPAADNPGKKFHPFSFLPSDQGGSQVWREGAWEAKGQVLFLLPVPRSLEETLPHTAWEKMWSPKTERHEEVDQGTAVFDRNSQ